MSVAIQRDQWAGDVGDERWTLAKPKPQSLSCIPDRIPLVGQISSEAAPELISPITLKRLATTRRRPLPRIATLQNQGPIVASVDVRGYARTEDDINAIIAWKEQHGLSERKRNRLAARQRQLATQPNCPVCGVPMLPLMVKGVAHRYACQGHHNGQRALICHGCRMRQGNEKARQSVNPIEADGPSGRSNPQPFAQAAHYSPMGDFLKVIIKPDAAVSERVDDVLTVYRSIETQEIVGCKIKGVSILAENVHTFIDVDADHAAFKFFLLAAKPSPEFREK